MKNTKGKWEIENRSDKITQVISYDINTAEAKDICVVSDDWNEQVANANLIASAPEMLKSLKLILDECRAVTVTGYHNKLMNIWEMAEETIAKAEGE